MNFIIFHQRKNNENKNLYFYNSVFNYHIYNYKDHTYFNDYERINEIYLIQIIYHKINNLIINLTLHFNIKTFKTENYYY